MQTGHMLLGLGLPEIDVPEGGELLADSPIWINRFSVPSDSNPNVEYTVSQNRKSRHWACSCMGFTRNGNKCKHLTRLNLPCFKEPYEARVAITASALPKSILRVAADANVVLPKPRRRFALPEEDI